MSKPAHTPAPWTLDTMDGAHHPRIYGADGTVIAEFGNAENWLNAKDRWVADAQIAVAAPDLYEALKDTTRMLRAVAMSTGLGDKQRARLAAADAVIAKAEGRQ